MQGWTQVRWLHTVRPRRLPQHRKRTAARRISLHRNKSGLSGQMCYQHCLLSARYRPTHRCYTPTPCGGSRPLHCRAWWSCFYRAMLCIRGTSHGPVSVCLCLSVPVTSRCSTKMAKRRITQTTPHDTPWDSSFLMPKISAKLPVVSGKHDQKVHPWYFG